MATIDEISQKVTELQTRYAAVANRRAQLEGEFASKKADLKALVGEIEKAGFNPSTLKEDRDKAQADLERISAEFEKQLVLAENGIAAYDARN